eukprot:gene5245-biopygen23668
MTARCCSTCSSSSCRSATDPVNDRQLKRPRHLRRGPLAVPGTIIVRRQRLRRCRGALHAARAVRPGPPTCGRSRAAAAPRQQHLAAPHPRRRPAHSPGEERHCPRPVRVRSVSVSLNSIVRPASGPCPARVRCRFSQRARQQHGANGQQVLRRHLPLAHTVAKVHQRTAISHAPRTGGADTAAPPRQLRVPAGAHLHLRVFGEAQLRQRRPLLHAARVEARAADHVRRLHLTPPPPSPRPRGPPQGDAPNLWRTKNSHHIIAPPPPVGWWVGRGGAGRGGGAAAAAAAAAAGRRRRRRRRGGGGGGAAAAVAPGPRGGGGRTRGAGRGGGGAAAAAERPQKSDTFGPPQPDRGETGGFVSVPGPGVAGAGDGAVDGALGTARGRGVGRQRRGQTTESRLRAAQAGGWADGWRGARGGGGGDFRDFPGARNPFPSAQSRAPRRASAPTRRAARARGGGGWHRRLVQRSNGGLGTPLVQILASGWRKRCPGTFRTFRIFITGGSKGPGNSALRAVIRTAARARSGRANDTDGIWE